MTTPEQFVTTTSIESKDPKADLEMICANTIVGGLMGLSPDIAEARAVVIARDNSGAHRAAVVHYNQASETPFTVQEKTIAEATYGRLSESFDALTGGAVTVTG